MLNGYWAMQKFVCANLLQGICIFIYYQHVFVFTFLTIYTSFNGDFVDKNILCHSIAY